MCVTGKKNSSRLFYPPRLIRLVSRSSISSPRPVPVPRLFPDSASFPSRRLAPTRTLLFVDTFSAVILPVVRPQM